MNTDVVFEGLKNIFEIIDNLTAWGFEVECRIKNFVFEGVCSFIATEKELIFVNHPIDEKAGVLWGIAKDSLFISKDRILKLSEKGFNIDFRQVYNPSLVQLIFRFSVSDGYIEIEANDIYYDTAYEGLQRITDEIYRIRQAKGG